MSWRISVSTRDQAFRTVHFLHHSCSLTETDAAEAAALVPLFSTKAHCGSTAPDGTITEAALALLRAEVERKVEATPLPMKLLMN